MSGTLAQSDNLDIVLLSFICPGLNVSTHCSDYEAKLCILCIVSGISNMPKSDLPRNPQHCYFSLIFYAVLESATKQMCRQNLRYRYMYAESTEILFVESTYILEHISRLVRWNSGTYKHKIVLLSSAQFGLVMVNKKLSKIGRCLMI